MPDSRPSVVLVAHSIHDRGGMERHFFELIRRQHHAVRFIVLATELDDELRELVEWRRIRVPTRPAPLRILVFAVLAGIRLTRTRATLRHTMGAVVPNRVTVATVQFCAAGFVRSAGRLAPAESPPLRRLNTSITRVVSLALERFCYRAGRVGVLAAVSRGVAAELERFYPGVPIALTPNGVDRDRFRADPLARAAVRDLEGVAEAAIVCLFVGGDWDRKGLAIAIDGIAAARLANVRLWVVGAGDQARFGSRAMSCGVDVRFFGPRTDAERFFAAADIFVLPTLYETFSLVAYEAAAASVPVVATRVSGIEELLENDGPGLLVERSASSVGAAIARLARDRELRLALGASGPPRVSSYDWELSIDKVVDVYRAQGLAVR